MPISGQTEWHLAGERRETDGTGLGLWGRAGRYCVILPTRLIVAACGVGGKDAMDFIADTPKDGKLLLFRTRGMRRVIESPMITIRLAWKNRARLIGITTNGDDGFHRLSEKFVEVL